MSRLRPLVLTAVLACALAFTGAALSQSPIKQIKLSEKQVQGFITLQEAMATITEKMQGSTSDKPDPKMPAELEAVAKKNGFVDFNEYDDVAANVAMFMARSPNQTIPRCSDRHQERDRGSHPGRHDSCRSEEADVGGTE